MPVKFANQSHKYEPGDQVYVRPWNSQGPTHDFTEPFIVLHQLESPSVMVELKCGDHVRAPRWPHYLLQDPQGGEWEVSQMELSVKPIQRQ